MKSSGRFALSYEVGANVPTGDMPVTARYVKYVVNRQRWVSITEVQVFDQIKYEHFDLKISLPKD